jgi:hypothetical protein
LFQFGEGYENVQEISPGIGYWLRFYNDGQTIIEGYVIPELVVTLNENWNLISGNATEIPVTSIIDTEGIIVPNTFYVYDEGYVNAETLLPGRAYWMRATESGTIIITNSVRGRRSRNTQEDLQSTTNTLKMNGTILYFGTEIEVENPLSFSLPPKPPAPSTDIRFSGDTKLCTTDECVVEIMNNGKPLEFDCEIKESESWEIVNESGNVTLCSGVQVLDVDCESETIVLRKSTSSQIPTEFALHPAHPNPFNPATTIRFSIPDVEMLHATSLRIYDITGKLVEILLDEKLSSGNHSVRWDGSGVSSGVYFVILEGMGDIKMRKLVLIK